MNKKELLNKVINEPKKPDVSECGYEVESFLETANEPNEEVWFLIDGIKKQGDAFRRRENLVTFLRQLYKRKYGGITLPLITKRDQVFVAMMFSTDTDHTYENSLKPVIQSLNFSAMRIDEKQFNSPIIGEIITEIADSVALIADLTGNRGGIYYKAGVARGLQLCNHPIKLIFICHKDFFCSEGVHIDVRGDNILLYGDENNLKKKLTARLKTVLKGGDS